MPESVTVASLASELREHQRVCAAEAVHTREAIVSLTGAIRAIAERLDGLGKSAWKGIGAVCLVVLAGVVSVIANSFMLHDQTQAKTADIAHELEASPTDTRSTKEILDAIRAIKQ